MKTATAESDLDMTYNDERITFIEYHDGRPYQVFTERTMFDFEWCESDGTLLFCQSGGGGVYVNATDGTWRAQFWSLRGIKITNDGNMSGEALTDDQLRAMGFDRAAEPLEGNPFDDACEGETVYCSVCKSIVNRESTCRHLREIDAGWYGCGAIGSGGDGAAAADDHKGAVFSLLSCFPVEAVRQLRDALARALTYDKRRQRAKYASGEKVPTRWLRPYRIGTSGTIFGADTLEMSFRGGGSWCLHEGDVAGLDETIVMIGSAWLLSLSTGCADDFPDTKEADAITLEWVEEYLATTGDEVGH